MKKSGILKLIALSILLFSFVSACTSDDSKNNASRNTKPTAEKTNTLPPLETSSTSTVPGTVVISNAAFLPPGEIATTWTNDKICGLVTGKQAQKILSMKTTPTGRYIFSSESGAKCIYRSSSGEELSIEISISSFANARIVDSALSSQAAPAPIKGVGGVVKVDKVFGVTYELNIGGDQTNQWIANAPTKSAAKSLAEALISALS